MAVERRVKPSTKMKQQLSRNRKPILIVAVVVVAVIAAGLIYFNFGSGTADGPHTNPNNPTTSDGVGGKDNTEAIKAMLADSVDYTGAWVVDDQGRFQVYLPGDQEVKADGVQSVAVRNNEGTTYAYGVTVGDEQLPTLGGDPTLDSGTVLKTVIDKTLGDVSLSFYGAKFSGSYDVSTLTLSDGSKALRVDGEMQTAMKLQAEGSATTVDTVMNFPMCGFIAIRDDWPVFVWGVADPDDGNAAHNMENYILECSTIFSAVTGNKGAQ